VVAPPDPLPRKHPVEESAPGVTRLPVVAVGR